MQIKLLIGQVFLFAIISLTSSSSSQGLVCSSDFIDRITCVWDSSSVEKAPDTSCILSGTLEIFFPEKEETVQSPLVPLQDSSFYTGTLQFSNEALPNSDITLPVSVHCGNQMMASIPKFDPQSNIKLLPPESLVVNGANVSWRLASRCTTYGIDQVSFQLQYRLLKEHWEDTDIVSIQKEHCLLPEEKLFLGSQYVIRVRSKIKESVHWSDWSRPTNWTSTVGKPPPTIQAPGFIPYMVIGLVIVMLILLCIHPIVRSLKNLYIPTPSPFFDKLDSAHKWDFKSWLGPLVTPEFFVKGYSEEISPVEVHSGPSTDVPYCKEHSCSHKGKLERNISSFCNSTYFLSQSSKCKMINHLESGSLQFSSGPVDGGSTGERVEKVTAILCSDTDNESGMCSPLETSSSYKHLQKLRLEVQSPDSGFSPGGEDQDSQEESGSEDPPSPPVVDNTLTIRHLPCPVPLMPHPDTVLPPLQNPLRLALSSGNMQPFEMPLLCITTKTLMADFDLMTYSGMVEPSSDDYMPVKKAQEC